MPDSERSSSSVSSRPATFTDPDVGRSSPPMRLRRVDLPEPEGPTTATSSPGRMVRLTPARAATGGGPGYTLVTSDSSREGDPGASAAGGADGTAPTWEPRPGHRR